MLLPVPVLVGFFQLCASCLSEAGGGHQNTKTYQLWPQAQPRQLQHQELRCGLEPQEKGTSGPRQRSSFGEGNGSWSAAALGVQWLW